MVYVVDWVVKFWSPWVTCKDVAGRPSVSCGRARCLIFAPPPTPSPSRRYMHTVKCERKNIMWKKTPVCTALGISPRGWGFDGRLVEASIYEARCSFLGVLHQLLVLALLDVAPPPVIFSENTSTSCPQYEDVHSSATPFAIVANRMQRPMLGLHHEQHLCLRSVTWSPSGKNNECIKRRPFPSTLYYHTVFFNVLPCWLWELESSSGFQWTTHSPCHFVSPSEIAGRSFCHLTCTGHPACRLHFDENENSSASYLSWPSTRLESFDVHLGKFSAEIDPNTTRTIASPQRAFFPWQLGVRKFTYLPDWWKSFLLYAPIPIPVYKPE